MSKNKQIFVSLIKKSIMKNKYFSSTRIDAVVEFERKVKEAYFAQNCAVFKIDLNFFFYN